MCLDEVARSGLAAIRYLARTSEYYEEDDIAVIEAYLRLDPAIVSALPDAHAREVERISAETTVALDGLLDAELAGVLRVEGLGALLASVDYPLVASFFCQLNELPPPGKNHGDYRDLFCSRPFEYAEIGPKGRTFLCCPQQLPQVVGDARDGTFLDVWNSAKAQAVRRSILDGTFSNCLESTCPALQSRALPRREDVTAPFLRDVIDNSRTRLDRGPITIFMNYDRSCNLACPTCRTRPIVLSGSRRDAAKDVQDWATAEHLRDARYLHVTGSGDAFGSNLFHGWLRKFDAQAFPGLRISIGTNGLLLTERNWQKICGDAVDVVVVSVDAATAATYAENRGGDFGVLLENLHFIGTLRSSGALKVYGMNFVVQANNYREIPAFVALGRDVHVDSVCFQQLINWGTFSNAEYAQRAVHRPDHPDHQDFLRVLVDRTLDDPIVDWSNLRTLRDDAVRRLPRRSSGG